MARIHMLGLLGLLVAFALMASGSCSPVQLFDSPPPFAAKDDAKASPFVMVPGGKSIPRGDVRTARMNIKALISQPEYLSLSLLQGLTVVAKKNSDTEDHGYGDCTVWSGHIKGSGPGESSATFTTCPDGSYYGLVRFCMPSEEIEEPCVYYFIKVESDAESGGQQGFIYKDEEPIRTEHYKLDQDIPEEVSLGGRRRMSGSGSDTSLQGYGSAELPHRQLSWMKRPVNIVQDVLVVYTQAAASAVGNDSAAINRVLTTIAETNQAYNDSGIPLTLRLVTKPIKVSYKERRGKDNDTIVQAHNDVTKGHVKSVHDLREQYGADLVLMVIDDNVGCGIAWSYTGASKWGYSVVTMRCLYGVVVAHEFGHNQGCDHNVGDKYGVKAYAYGWRRCDLRKTFVNWGTIMSYPCDVTPRNTYYTMLFSNPNVFVTNRETGEKYPAGDAKTSFCAKAIALTALTISEFRATVNANSTTRPPPPTIE